MKKLLSITFLFFALVQSSGVAAQDLLNSANLSAINVDFLSDMDIQKIRSQLASNKVTIEQAEPMALAKGMPSSEFEKLKARLGAATKLTTSSSGNDFLTETISVQANREQEKIENAKKVKDSINNLVFGSDLFDKPTLNFEPNLKMATPINYILGPGDELQVSVYGVQEFSSTVPITFEGKVVIKFVGHISVSGMTVEAATKKIKSAIAAVYSTVRSGQSQVSVSLSRVRTIKITLIGSKLPGNFSISSLGTVYNALFLGGGPAINGSYRNIELIRNGKVIKTIDIYGFLVNGNQTDNLGLKEGDIIRIPSYTQRVTVEGQVKRPGIFEMKTGETFQDLLRFASGFNEYAYTSAVTVLQKTGKEMKIKDIKASEFKTYQPRFGDEFTVTKILDRFENRLQIKGAVFRPNQYSYSTGMRLADLVTKADGLKEDAYTARATIIRLKDDLTKETVSVNLAKALAGDFEHNIELKKEDIVTVFSILDLKEQFRVNIDGEVKKPGTYEYQEKLSLNDLILQAGGLTGSASKRVEIARMIASETIDDANPNKVDLFTIEITPENNEQAKNFVLAPFDVINIRRMAMYAKPEMVSVTGAVNYTGKYVLATKQERIFSVIQRAGGLTSMANIYGVRVKRPIQSKQIEDIETVDFSVANTADTTANNKLTKKLKEEMSYTVIPIDWKSVLRNPKRSANISLLPGDEIEVATFNEGIKVTGNVLLNSEIPYNGGRGFKYYLNAVGGADAKGWKRKAYIIYPNGRAAVSHSFMFIRSYPKVLPGSQIVVPERPLKKPFTIGEFATVASVLSSLTLLFLTAFK
jgi:protein involved in polysaccharide export with SLBB domain